MFEATFEATGIVNGIPAGLETKEAQSDPPSTKEVKAVLDDIMSTVTEFREASEKRLDELESKGSVDPLLEEKIEKIGNALDVQEEKNQELAKELEAKKAEKDEFDTRFKDIELELAKKSAGNDPDWRESDEFKAFNLLCAKGYEGLDVEEKQLLRTDQDISGGFLVPTELDSELRKLIVELDAIRSVARVRTMSVKTLEIPVRTSIPVAEFEGEAETGVDDTSEYNAESVTAFRQSVTVPATMDLLNDSAFNIESEIASDVATSFAEGEGRNFITGDGFKKPKGFLADTRITDIARDSISASVLDADDILLLTGDLKSGYDPTFILNRRTLAFIRTLKSDTGQYLWQPGINGVVMNTLAGEPYLIANSMPDIADNAFPIAFGDFRRGYEIYDRTGTTVIRDNVTRKRQAIIEWTFHRWLTGQVIIPEAITALKIST
ncbi:MAG: phage major capsid protein [Gammaproteobacteria bacterium]